MFEFIFSSLTPSNYEATNLLFFLAPSLLSIFLFTSLVLHKKRRGKTFLVDFSCYKPAGVANSCSKEGVRKRLELIGYHTDETIKLMVTAMDKAGLSDYTYYPENMLRIQDPDGSMKAARHETETVMFGAIDELLAKTSVKVEDIGILIVNCSLFNVIPSLSSIIVNRYKLRENIASYNLSGMGCTCGLVAIGLANQLLKVHPNTYALIVSTENITGHYYRGNDRSKVVVNSLFRLGGAAIMLSNKPSDAKSSKYQFIHAVHTNTASSDLAYNCIFQEEDEEGFVGVTINKDLIVSAVKAIKMNLTTLGPLVLPLSEKLLVLKNLVSRKIIRKANIAPYIPKFSKGIHHFFPHVGGKPVLDELQKNLGFSDATMEASRMTLYRFGNTSSSSVWYALAYAEAKGRIKKGDLVWQMAFGSGFKCSSVIWRAMKGVDYVEANPWSGEIHKYPQYLDNIKPVTNDEFFFEPST